MGCTFEKLFVIIRLSGKNKQSHIPKNHEIMK